MKWVLRGLLALILGWCALVEVVAGFVWNRFGLLLDGDWFLMLAASSPEEIREFCGLYSADITLVVVAVVLLMAAVALLSFLAKGRILIVFFGVVVAYFGWRGCSEGLRWRPLYLAFDTLRGTAQYVELLEASEWKGDLLPGAKQKAATATNVVFVIGESMTTDHMSLYGYAKKTTPCLDARRAEMTVLPPVRATHPATVPAMRMMLTRATLAEPSRAIETAAVAFRRRGYTPMLLSAQPKWGRFCGIEQRLFAACETKTYLSDSEHGPGVFDGVLVECLRRDLTLVDPPFAAFVHLTGSHMDPKNRVPPDFETPEGFSDYDRSVYYTDSVLEAFIRSLPPRTMLIYTSDHGETPDGGGWRNAASPSLWRVPFVVWPKLARDPKIESMDQMFDWLFSIL